MDNDEVFGCRIFTEGGVPLSLGESVRFLRKKRNLTQGDLARAVGVSLESISRWERGSRTPSLDDLQKLAKILDTTVSFLAGEAEVPPAQAVNTPIDVLLPKENFDTSIFSTTYEHVKKNAKSGSLKELQLAKAFLNESLALLEDSIEEKSQRVETKDQKGAVA